MRLETVLGNASDRVSAQLGKVMADVARLERATSAITLPSCADTRSDALPSTVSSLMQRP